MTNDPRPSRRRFRMTDSRTVAALVVGTAMVGAAVAVAPHLTAQHNVRSVADVMPNTTNSTPASTKPTGQMCAFYAPGSQLGIETGHVGWAVDNPGTDQWVLGSGDGPHGQGSVSGNNPSSVTDGGSSSLGSASGTSADGSRSGTSHGFSGSLSSTGNAVRPADAGVPQYNGDSSKEMVWVTRSPSFGTVLQDFESFGWYTEYRCLTTTGGDANAAYITAQNDGSFSIIGNNCLNHAWKSLDAYQSDLLSPAPLTPNGWFHGLGATDGFGPIHAVPNSGNSDQGSSGPPSGS